MSRRQKEHKIGIDVPQNVYWKQGLAGEKNNESILPFSWYYDN